MKKNIQQFNHSALSLIEHIGLLVIAIATVFAMSSEVMLMLDNKTVTLTDLLMLFLYLEVVAMIQRYYTSGKLPVRFPLYIGIVALARYLILDMKSMDEWRLIAITSSILLLAMAILLIRYGHVRYPYLSDESAPAPDKSENTH
jgi:protein PsiE